MVVAGSRSIRRSNSALVIPCGVGLGGGKMSALNPYVAQRPATDASLEGRLYLGI